MQCGVISLTLVLNVKLEATIDKGMTNMCRWIHFRAYMVGGVDDILDGLRWVKLP